MTPSNSAVLNQTVSNSFPSFSEILSVLSFQAGYNTSLVLTGAIFLGICAGLCGTFALLRKRALLGDALAHSSLPGIAAAYIIMWSLGSHQKSLPVLLLGACISGLLGVICVQMLSRYTRLKEDAAIGAVLSVFFGCGIVLLGIAQSLPGGTAAGLNHFIYGQTAAMQLSDTYLIVALTSLALVFTLALKKEFTLLCFDRDFAQVNGWPILVIDIAMMALLTTVTVVGLRSVGMLLIIAMLILPAAASRFWSENLKTLMLVSALIGGLSGYLGAGISALSPRLPAGAVIVLCAGVVFFISFFFGPNRGLFASFLRQLSLRHRILRDHLLRDIIEKAEISKSNPEQKLLIKEQETLQELNPLYKYFFLGKLEREELLTRGGSSFKLTDLGLKKAQAFVHQHRLWEHYLIEYAGISASHVDFSADKVEHILSAEIVKSLEAKISLEDQERSSQIPSPHTLSQENDRTGGAK